MTLDLFKTMLDINMLKNLLGAAVIAAVGFTVAPASAAKMAACSDVNMQKTESATEAMADGPYKTVAQQEIAQAEHAKLDGKMGACAMHLTNAMHPDAMKQPSVTTAQAPQGDWKPLKGAE
jgi:hypothetical protein